VPTSETTSGRPPTTLVVATRNRGKLEELTALLSGLRVVVCGLDGYPDAPQVEETGSTFAENARLKALTAADATGHMALADDSGLAVAALGGQPGVMSARYAGEGASYEDLCRKLLVELEGVPPDQRGARFLCVVALARPGEVLWTVEGACEGRITESTRGRGGFGYDPVFFYPPLGRTFAELTREEKNAVSHRGRALRKAREKLREWIDTVP